MLNYSQKVLDHFKNPRNVGKLEKADGVGEVGNLVCGDVMRLFIRVEDEVIKEISFETYGCAAAIATSSVITEMVKGKTISEVLKMSNKDIIDNLDGLPPIKIHCSLLSVDALSEAIWDYYQKKGKRVPKELKKRHERIEKLRKI
jgi:nitrogen fixation NifU-like protein